MPICRPSSAHRRLAPDGAFVIFMGPEATRRALVLASEDSEMMRTSPAALGVAAALLLATGAAAHTGEAAGGGFLTGFLHPVLGWDHVAAMVAVGLWSAFLGPPAIWLLPVTFPLVMALGGAAGIAGVPIAGIEFGIAASALIVGLAVLLAWRPPLVIAAVVVGFFAIFHGHAHGTEMPQAASPLAYAVGFVVGTGLLHLGGIALGLLARSRPGAMAVRGLGAVIALAGLGFLVGTL
jgi:urease accessory protein